MGRFVGTCVKGCLEVEIVGRGFCAKHYKQAIRRGMITLTLEEALEKQHDVNLWAHHKIRLSDAQEKWVKQNRKCACCKTPGPEIYIPSRDWPIDHDRDCCPTSTRRGKCEGSCTRGIVCRACNNEALTSHMTKDNWLAVGLYLGYIS